jgi:cell division protein FtsN
MDLVQLGSYNSKTEAELVKARLASAGIDAIVQSDDLGSTTPMLGGFRGVLVLVREVDRVDALEVLERMLPGGES